MSSVRAVRLPACIFPLPCRRRECISDQHYFPSLLASYGLDNEVGHGRRQLALMACNNRGHDLWWLVVSCTRTLPCFVHPMLPPLPLLMLPQTTCDPTGGTWQQWVDGAAEGDTATDLARGAVQREEGQVAGHMMMFQPGHVNEGAQEGCL